MSGHSKWSTIKRDKAAKDSKRSQIFTKVGRAITVAAKERGGDVNTNPTLRLAVEKAKEARMPKENIEKAIQKGLGVSSSENFEEVTYEGYGPGGVAFIVFALTGNKNRTVSEIRNIFNRYGGSLGGAGSTSYIFANNPKNPNFFIEIDDESMRQKVSNMLEEFENLDDVQEAYSNLGHKSYS